MDTDSSDEQPTLVPFQAKSDSKSMASYPMPQTKESKNLTEKIAFISLKVKGLTKTVIGVRKSSYVKLNIVQETYVS